MPEGDTIFRAARALDRALAGQAVEAFDTVFPALHRQDLVGRVVEHVRSAGKHVLMTFSGGLVLRTHMRMNGSWHLYRRGERWRRPRADMRIRLAMPHVEAVGFRIPVAELIPAAGLARHEALRTLGPDLLGGDFDPSQAFDRLRAGTHATIAELLLDQRAMAGVGNVYKSEILFLCRVHPFAPPAAVDDAALRRIVETAHRLLRANVSESLPLMTTYGGFRRTTGRDDPGARLWVYGRARRPCRRCGTPIASRRHGIHARSTYWCPRCQPAAGTEAPA